MKSLLATVFGGVLVGTAMTMSPAHAATLYTQPLDNSLAGRFSYSASPGQLLADDFSIPEGGLISQVSWYGEAFFGQPFADFRIQFY